MGIFYIVATPIGNLEDMTFRGLRVLQEADVAYAEDTRVARKLFSRHDIATSVRAYHQRSGEKTMAEILRELQAGRSVALITDSGTPGISDPGNELISYLLGREPELSVVPIPGPSAVTAAASVSGFPMNSFLFLGFPPAKKGRKKFLEEVAASPRPVVFYESPHRILKTLRELQEAYTRYEIQATRYQLAVGRELTKRFETVYRGTLEDVLARLAKEKTRGEFVVIVSPRR